MKRSLLTPALGLVALGMPSDPPPEALTWLRESALPLRTLEIDDQGFGDLAALGEIVGDAPVLLVGEATHGSSEFFRFKHRLFAALVAEHGFTDFVMETDWTAAQRASAWIEGGEGDVETALRGVSGLWRTEAYRDLFLWMRAWNEDPSHGTELRLFGMDMQAPPAPATDQVLAYLAEADPELVEILGPTIGAIGRLAPVEDFDLEGVLPTLDELEEDLVDATSREAYDLARQGLVVALQRYRQTRLSGDDATDWRDTCMAENVRWIHRTAGPGRRLLVSAHNGHVSRAGLAQSDSRTIQSVGRALAEDGPEIVVLGTAFGGGAFRAIPQGGGPTTEFRLASQAPGAIETDLLAAGLELALFDLRTAPAGAVRAWLATPRPTLEVGGLWNPAWAEDPDYPRLRALPDEFDALLFVAETTAARPLDT